MEKESLVNTLEITEAERELNEDKCCFVLPIVGGMQTLGFVMLIFNFIGFIASLIAVGTGVENNTLDSFSVVLGVIAMILNLLILGGIGKWFFDIKQRDALIRGMYANLAQAILSTYVMYNGSDALITAAIEQAEVNITRHPGDENYEEALRLL